MGILNFWGKLGLCICRMIIFIVIMLNVVSVLMDIMFVKLFSGMKVVSVDVKIVMIIVLCIGVMVCGFIFVNCVGSSLLYFIVNRIWVWLYMVISVMVKIEIIVLVVRIVLVYLLCVMLFKMMVSLVVFCFVKFCYGWVFSVVSVISM